MSELQELKHIMETLMAGIVKGPFEIEKTPLHELTKITEYNYYHSDKDKFKEILPISKIATLDNQFTRSLVDKSKYAFPEFGPFFRGCVSITSSFD